jgi:RpiR family carbohydrate utilization transcriptional regulator
VDENLPVSLNMRIMRKYDDLTASEKKVADAVLMLGENIIDHNIASLAIESRVSEPTVVRFCRSIGLGGIKELKKAALQSTIAESPPTSSSMDLNKLETDEQLIPFVIDNLTFILNETKKLIREDSLQKAIELLSNTTYVKIVGYGGSFIVARHIHHYLRMAGMHVDLFRNQEDYYPTMREQYNNSDVIIAISYSGNSNIVLDLVRDAKAKGAKVIGITSWGECKLNSLADVALHSYYNGDGILPGIHAFERLSQMAIADMLIAGLYKAKQK